MRRTQPNTKECKSRARDFGEEQTTALNFNKFNLRALLSRGRRKTKAPSKSTKLDDLGIFCMVEGFLSPLSICYTKKNPLFSYGRHDNFLSRNVSTVVKFLFVYYYFLNLDQVMFNGSC